ncbi:hypothetical protein M3B61_11740 [Micrococcus luteus]|nr:hypothetical protein [Micrococcus luteus]MCV7583880.1 hypothetical protein [Micrococcus luteus]MCV7588321.1 hypothetical protein [Micrococcus luteus]
MTTTSTSLVQQGAELEHLFLDHLVELLRQWPIAAGWISWSVLFLFNTGSSSTKGPRISRTTV